ncbi:MAG: hypothetical protein WA057_00885, partial [Candidatus Magasanikiibacteriota bacterium]
AGVCYDPSPTCVPNCDNKQCGNNGCGGSCGTCAEGFQCDFNGVCYDPTPTCVPNCDNKQCGNNGCGGSCGTCNENEFCDAAGQCIDLFPNPCQGVVCDNPPVDTCVGGLFTSYASTGTCVGGTCSYEDTQIECEFGCQGNTCAPNPDETQTFFWSVDDLGYDLQVVWINIHHCPAYQVSGWKAYNILTDDEVGYAPSIVIPANTFGGIKVVFQGDAASCRVDVMVQNFETGDLFYNPGCLDQSCTSQFIIGEANLTCPSGQELEVKVFPNVAGNGLDYVLPSCSPLNCDDGDACTDDVFVGGYCDSLPMDPDDGDVCTTDMCNTQTGAVHTPMNCNDNNLCTVDACDPATGACVHQSKSCDDQNVCTIDSCNSLTGACDHTNVIIDDADPCTVDACHTVGGVTHTPKSCDDQNVCTIDSCNSLTGACDHNPACDDGNLATADVCATDTGECSHFSIYSVKYTINDLTKIPPDGYLDVQMHPSCPASIDWVEVSHGEILITAKESLEGCVFNVVIRHGDDSPMMWDPGCMAGTGGSCDSIAACQEQILGTAQAYCNGGFVAGTVATVWNWDCKGRDFKTLACPPVTP